MPGSTQTKTSIYRDAHVRSTRSQIQGYPAIEPKKLDKKNSISIDEMLKIQQTEDKKSDSDPKRRAMEIYWMAVVSHKFRFEQKTLVLAVNILDQYLTKVRVPRSQLQLVAAAALNVAHVKLEEITATNSDFVYMARDNFTLKEFTDMSAKVADSTDENANTSYDFLMKYVEFMSDMSKEQMFLAHYVLELSLFKLSCSFPSEMAAAVLKITRDYYNLPWPSKLTNYIGHSIKVINICSRSILRLANSSSKTIKSVKRIYSTSEYGGASSLDLSKVTLSSK
jgi:hypothetical protein